jgi:chromosome segregation ATPase
MESHVCRSQLTAAQADAHIQQQRLSAAEATAATTAAQLLEAQANLSKARAEAASLQQDSDGKLAAAKLSCGGCAEKAGKLLEVQQQLQPTQAMLAEQRQHCKSLEDQLEAVRAELQGAKASLAAAQQVKDQLHYQLHGCLEAPSAGSAGYEPYAGTGYLKYGGYAPGSPTRMQMQMQLVPAEEGLIQRCSALSMQLQQQEVELGSLRQQLLEQQLALSEAQTSCGSAERQLQQAAYELKAAHSAAADASAAASAAREDARAAQQHAQQLQQTLASQQPELAANKAQVQRLEAQQQVLLGK